MIYNFSFWFFHNNLKISKDFDIIYKSPGVPTSRLILEDPDTKISSITDIIFSSVKGKIIGVTGTKGKSTISSLLYYVLKESGFDVSLLGNIGIVSLGILKEDNKDKICVYETSSFQCEHINSSPHIAILTNIYPCHLDQHGTFENYEKAKLNITAFQSPEDFLITTLSNIKTEASSIIIDEEIGNVKEIDIKKEVNKAKQVIISSLFNEEKFSLGKKIKGKFNFETKLKGNHNQNNIFMAYIALRILGLDSEEIKKYIKKFEPLAYRLEKIAEKSGVVFYDDSLATIPEATKASIEALENVDTIILGGLDVGILFDDFAKYLKTTKINNFIIFPDTGEKMIKYIKDKNIFRVKDMKTAVKLAKKHTKGICLLSNASPSQNLFKNYKDKSEQYRYWIKND